tara:strand:- start:440 stop:1126 length:687 start_codon:yes stop_codon:yes gene_type:complete
MAINNKKVVSITLSRGGSKGVPRKNLIDVCGKPLVGRMIDTIKASRFVDQVWISTDDNEIGNVSRAHGAQVLSRPPELATDSAKCEHALEHFSQIVDYDIMCFVQTTSPLLLTKDLDAAVEFLVANNYDSIFSTTEETWVPRWEIKGDTVEPFEWEPDSRPRRQQMPTLLIENGAFYITTREAFEKSKLRYSGRVGYYRMPLKRSFQIDTQEELDLIRNLIRSGAHLD